jgi:hypothetical protein
VYRKRPQGGPAGNADKVSATTVSSGNISSSKTHWPTQPLVDVNCRDEREGWSGLYSALVREDIGKTTGVVKEESQVGQVDRAAPGRDDVRPLLDQLHDICGLR